jgi:hypothetical protein
MHDLWSDVFGGEALAISYIDAAEKEEKLLEDLLKEFYGELCELAGPDSGYDPDRYNDHDFWIFAEQIKREVNTGIRSND